MNHYLNEEGLTVFTSAYHRKKGSCCHSNCLHCPYGTTLKNIGLVVDPVVESNLDRVKILYDELYGVSDAVTESLLAGAFGSPKKEPNWNHFSILSLKGIICGLMETDQGQVKSFKLKEHFSDQGITESYLNSIL